MYVCEAVSALASYIMYELRFSRKTDVFSALLSLRESGTKNFLCVTRKLIRT